MLIPDDIDTAVNEGNVSAVVAWLDAGGDVNDVMGENTEQFIEGDNMLMALGDARSVTSRTVELAKLLLQRGADVNRVAVGDDSDYSPLQCIIEALPIRNQRRDPAALIDILGIYLAAGANVNHKNRGGMTALGMALRHSTWYGDEGNLRLALGSVKLLLRAGASLDACNRTFDASGGTEQTAEELLRERRIMPAMAENEATLADNEVFLACEVMVADVRAAGSWKAYTRAPPKALLRLRSLVARDRARVRKERTRGKTPREVVLLFAPTFPNDLFWRVLEYWNPRYEALRTPSTRSV